MSWLILSSLLLISVSTSFIFLTHPLAMGFTLISQTVLICSVVGLSSKLSWFSYILFLIFLGATLVLFIYVAALASNETFKLSLSMMLIIAGITALLTVLLFFNEQSIFLQNSIKDSWLSSTQEFSSTYLTLSNIYSNYNFFLTGLVILYLLLALLVVVEISSTFFGPLRLS